MQQSDGRLTMRWHDWTAPEKVLPQAARARLMALAWDGDNHYATEPCIERRGLSD